jgi:hypothetical protein
MASYGSDELLGFDLLGKPWTAVLAQKIFKDTGDQKLRDVMFSWHPPWNTTFVAKLKKLSTDNLLPGANRWVYMNANGPSTDAINKSFFDHINDADVKDAPPDLPFNFNMLMSVAGLVAVAVIVAQIAPLFPRHKKSP